MNRKVIAAMSGGVDSSVAAYLMQQAGYEVTGVMMRLFDDGCSDNSEDARRVAEKLGAAFILLDMREEFRTEVIDKFVAAYENGRTPNPCVICNRQLKFGLLRRRAMESLYAGIHPDDVMIATGHYAIIECDEASGRYKLRKASDLSKDQSYFLYGLSQEQLARTAFPLGALSKDEVRRVAGEQGFVTAHKKESQDICFIPDGEHAEFIKRYTGRDYSCGDFTDAKGRVLGKHKGIIRYTIGQRKGLGLALGEPAYVQEIDAENNRVVLGSNEDLFKRELTATDFNWVSVAPPSSPFRASARIRYRHREAPCEVIPMSEHEAASHRGPDQEAGRVRIVFDEPQRAITSGQSVVLYGGDSVLGGGIIE